MKIKFQYRYMGVTYPCIILATCVYYDPVDSTLNISDGVSWWEMPTKPLDGECFVSRVFRDGFLDLTNFPSLFSLCK